MKLDVASGASLITPFKGLGELFGLGGNPPGLNVSDPIAYDAQRFIALSKVQTIKTENWNKLLPYYFTVLGGAAQGFKTMTLAIPPSSVSVQTVFANALSATNNGILEEHNGVIFRNIEIRGTTGIWPTKPTQPKKGEQGLATKLVANIFPGAVSAVQGLANQVRNTVATVTGPSKEPRVPKEGGEIIDIYNTGYYQFWILHNFFVAYAEAKKTKDGRDLRLVFGSVKDNIGYVCTPQSFSLSRDASNPLLYRYSIGLKCWDLTKEVEQLAAIDVLEGLPTPDNVAAFKAMANTLVAARQTIQGARNILSGVHSDFASIMNVYNQTMMVVKETAGLVSDIRDFPDIIQTNSNVLLKGSTNSMIQALKDAGVLDATYTGTEDEPKSPGSDVSDLIGNDIPSASKTPHGEDKPRGNFRLNESEGAMEGAATNDAFLDTPLADIDLPPSVQNQIDQAFDQAQQLTPNEVRELSSDLKEMDDNFIRSVGGMDSTYAATYGLPDVSVTTRTPTDDDIILSAGLSDASYSTLQSLGTGQLFQEREYDPFATANQNLDQDDQMQSPGSTIPVPFERGATIETLAQRYLGDASRAREIELLNGLRSPFIDEVGFQRNITNALGRTFVVVDNTNLAINQSITISGNALASTRRRIINIEDIGVGFKVTVDGPANLGIYAPASSPKISFRTPGTVGPGDILLIPSEELVDNDIPTRPSAIESRLSKAEKVFKIDLCLDAELKDLSVGPDGDVKRCYGYTNAIQALRLAVETEEGELADHPEYGLPVRVGSRSSDQSLNEINRKVHDRIVADPRFAAAEVVSGVDGSVVRIAVTAHGAKAAGSIPVEFEIGKV